MGSENEANKKPLNPRVVTCKCITDATFPSFITLYIWRYKTLRPQVEMLIFIDAYRFI